VVAKFSTWPSAQHPAMTLTVQAVTALAGALQDGRL
jgi:hypothetical protein